MIFNDILKTLKMDKRKEGMIRRKVTLNSLRTFVYSTISTFDIAYRRIFYKVGPALVFDLVTRLQQDPKNPKPMYTVEVFMKDGTDPQKSRDHILQTTGSVPAIFDKGTHYVSHHHLNLEILKKMNDIDYVLEVMSDYTGSEASIGPQHDIGDWSK
jgi:hypothetical protein